jgi:TM2 domain-containing membrane protein YozV
VPETILDAADQPARHRGGPWLPCLLAWLAPGLGHLYLGKKGRAAVFFSVVALTLFLGIASDGASSVIDPRQPLTYLATFDNLAVGPLEILGRYATYGRLVYRMPEDEGNPQRTELTDRQRRRVRSVTYEYGNTFLLTAGLMNILLMLDAFDIASGRKD